MGFGLKLRWFRFIWAAVANVDGFVPKLKAIARVVAFMRK
jgi:hypothetical protein